MERSAVDISRYSYDEFVAFMFARDVQDARADGEELEPWYWNADVTFVPEHICRYYTQLFHEPDFLIEHFSKAQLEQGFWAIQGPNLECSVRYILEDTDLPFAVRERCIRSMFELFRRLFAIESLNTSVSMWWDSMCYDWHCGNRRRDRGGEDMQLQDVLFETLAKILSLDSEICQGSALHGLGHLHHPGTMELVDHYLQERPLLTKEWKAYALAAAKFEIM
jgi:hypothetical protein